VFQVVAYAALGYFYLAVLPGWLGLEQSTLDVSMLGIAKIVLIFWASRWWPDISPEHWRTGERTGVV